MCVENLVLEAPGLLHVPRCLSSGDGRILQRGGAEKTFPISFCMFSVLYSAFYILSFEPLLRYNPCISAPILLLALGS